MPLASRHARRPMNPEQRRKINRVHYRTLAGHAAIIGVMAPLDRIFHSTIPFYIAIALIACNLAGCLIQLSLFGKNE